jgi:UDPglucose 6-dehydrogenase
VSCPEFLREGSAIADFMSPHRTVIGSTAREAAEKVAQLHLPLRAPIVITDLRTAEMIKYASNAFLATKISFMNELANLCDRAGADISECVAAGMGYDRRIGHEMLSAGLGWGGSCFPKDVQALAFMAKEQGLKTRILDSVMEVNYEHRRAAVEALQKMVGGELQGKLVGLLGLAFKPNTDDLRDAPSVDIARALQDHGATVRAYDPVAMEAARALLPEVSFFDDPYQMASGCDALMIITEWNEFKQLDLERLKRQLRIPIMYDGRNIYDPGAMQSMGWTYQGVGRGNGAS